MNIEEIVQALLDARDQQSEILVVVNTDNALPYKITIRPLQGEEQVHEIDERTMIQLIGENKRQIYITNQLNPF